MSRKENDTPGVRPADPGATVAICDDHHADTAEHLKQFKSATAEKEIARHGTTTSEYTTGKPKQLWMYQSPSKPIPVSAKQSLPDFPGRESQ